VQCSVLCVQDMWHTDSVMRDVMQLGSVGQQSSAVQCVVCTGHVAHGQCNLLIVTEIAQSVYRLATSLTVRGSNPGGGEIFRTRADRPWGLPNLLYNGYLVSFPGVKRTGCGFDHPPSSRSRVKGRVELYL
jgi:hypothetical protein